MARHQITETRAIITTPKQLDIITRKSTDISYTTLVQLFTINEIHFFHSAHGLVLGHHFLDHPAHGITNKFRHLVDL